MAIGYSVPIQDLPPSVTSQGEEGLLGPAIQGLEAGLMPVRAFPLRKWFYASPLWYYHVPALHHRLRRDPKFYELVDPQLRPLCRMLQQAGLYTTPSCQGHFYPRERFERIWAELARDEAAIHGPGLPVKDSETDGLYLFRDRDYRVPWSDFEGFHRDADAHQNRGYIGIALPREEPELLRRLQASRFEMPTARLAFDEELSEILGHPLLGIHVTAQTPAQRDLTWEAVTAFIRSLLERG